MAIATLVPVDVAAHPPHRDDVKLGLGTEEGGEKQLACARMEKKRKCDDAMGVETILRQTAEIEMVLVGMAALRGGAPPSSVECHLAVKAYSNLEGLAQRVAPSDLVSKTFLQSFIQQFTPEPVESTPTPAQGVSIPSMGASATPASASAPGKRSRIAVKAAKPKAKPKRKVSKNSVTRFKPPQNDAASGTRTRVGKGPRSLHRGRGAKVVAEPRRQIHRQIAREIEMAMPDVSMAPLSETAAAYIKPPIRCETCKVLMNDTSQVLICDGCESGFHLRCLQMRKRSDIPERDWYCSKCEALSGSHSRPSVYGPLRRGRGRRGSGTTWILKNDPSTKASEYRLKLRNTHNGGAAEASHAQVESSPKGLEN